MDIISCSTTVVAYTSVCYFFLKSLVSWSYTVKIDLETRVEFRSSYFWDKNKRITSTPKVKMYRVGVSYFHIWEKRRGQSCDFARAFAGSYDSVEISKRGFLDIIWGSAARVEIAFSRFEHFLACFVHSIGHDRMSRNMCWQKIMSSGWWYFT